MKFDKDKNYGTIALYAFVTIILSALVIVGVILKMDFSKYIEILTPFLYAFGIAYLLNKIVDLFVRNLSTIYEKLNKKTKAKANPKLIKYVSIILAYVISLLCIYLFARVLAPQLSSSVMDLMNNYQRYIHAGSVWLESLIERYPFLESLLPADEFEANISAITGYIIELVKDLSPRVIVFVESLAQNIKNILFGLFISIYMLIGKERFKAQTKKLMSAYLPRESYDKIIKISYESDYRFGGFIVGKIIDSLIIGIICYICCLIFSFPFAALVSFIIGVTNIIPIAGPFIGAIPSGFLILLADPTKFIWFILFVFVLQQLDGNFIGPKILGDKTGLPAFWVLVALIIMGGLYGIMGMLIAVPLFSVIYYELKLITEKRLSDRGLPTDTTDYATEDEAKLILPTEKSKGKLSDSFKKIIAKITKNK